MKKTLVSIGIVGMIVGAILFSLQLIVSSEVAHARSSTPTPVAHARSSTPTTTPTTTPTDGDGCRVEHWDKIIFKIKCSGLARLLNLPVDSLLDIKILDDPTKIVDLNGAVLSFLEGMLPLGTSLEDARNDDDDHDDHNDDDDYDDDIEIVDVEYAVVCIPPAPAPVPG